MYFKRALKKKTINQCLAYYNFLKVAGIRKLLSDKNRKNIKASGKKRIVFLHLLHFRDLSDSPAS
ncbi:hypothetical protein AP3564_01455 [Aeribacillus pallidus]|uniref:Uncharacterized protein n=1 Tax=Aeribacillus pallidus TaxID=33936 RepID=A0A223E1P0_9BACI|nr:hypothetical protein AP3564_01455 [Aeribacillus pallidus]